MVQSSAVRLQLREFACGNSVLQAFLFDPENVSHFALREQDVTVLLCEVYWGIHSMLLQGQHARPASNTVAVGIVTSVNLIKLGQQFYYAGNV